MNQLKGFVLIEVLIALFLFTAVILFLLHQQRLQKQLLQDLQNLAKASQFLNQMQELQRAKHATPTAPFPYHFKKNKQSEGLYWGHYSLVRTL